MSFKGLPEQTTLPSSEMSLVLRGFKAERILPVLIGAEESTLAGNTVVFGPILILSPTTGSWLTL